MSETHSSIGPVESTLRGIRDLLSDEKRWTKGAYARDEYGFNTGLISPGARCWCLEGAIFYLIFEAEVKPPPGLTFRCLRDANGIDVLHVWNDAPQRTHADVLAATGRAIDLAHERGL